MGPWVRATMACVIASMGGKLNHRDVDCFVEDTEVLMERDGVKHKPIIASNLPRDSFERPKCIKEYVARLFARYKVVVGRYQFFGAVRETGF